jgi:hypothetical protein
MFNDFEQRGQISIFKKKFNNILVAEKINATALANKAGITIVVSYA